MVDLLELTFGGANAQVTKLETSPYMDEVLNLKVEVDAHAQRAVLVQQGDNAAGKVPAALIMTSNASHYS